MAGTINFSTGLWIDISDPADGINDAPAASVYVDLLSGYYTAYSAGGASGSGATTATNAIGTSGADFMAADSGGSTLQGLGGDDVLSGDDGNDTLEGGAGDDEIYDFAGGAAHIDGGADNDLIFIGTTFASGSISGGSGSDTLKLTYFTPVDLSHLSLSGLEGLWTEFSVVTATAAQFDAFDIIYARAASGQYPGDINREVYLVLAAVGGSTTLDLSDELSGSGGRPLYLTGSSDSETVIGTTLWTNTMHGGGGADTLSGGNVEDYIWGDAGNDTLNGGDSEDQLYGGDDDDTLNGGNADDYLEGDDGDDTLNGDSGDDLLRAGAGEDLLHGGSGKDSLEGGDGDDELNGDGDDDNLWGEGGEDTLNGGDGADSILGGDDADTIDGGDGDDFLGGEDGDDEIDGGDGTDTIDGGDGDDTIRGGAARDFITDLLGSHTDISGDDGDDLIGIRGFASGTIDGGSGDDLLGVVENVDLTFLTLTSIEFLETNGFTVKGRVADLDPFTTIVKSASGVAIPVDFGAQVNLTLVATGTATTLDLVDALGDHGGRGVKLFGTSDDETVVGGKLKSNELHGLEGKDTLTGGDEKDTIEGGTGDDVIYGTKGSGETLDGGDGQDVFDFSGKVAGKSTVMDLTTGTKQSLKGGGNPSKTLVDELKLSGSPNDYRFNVTIGGSWESTKTTVVQLTAAGSTRVTLTTDQIEKASFNDPLDNPISLYQGNATLEMAKSMIEVYGESTTAAFARKWHQVAAMELGMMPSDYGSTSRYTFKDGVYENVVASNDAVASVVSGVAGGKRTLSIAFKGSDDPIDFAVDLAQARDLYFKHYAPLFDAIKKYLASDGSSIQKILITGHSLGGAMVQHAVSALTAAGHGGKIEGFTFGSIGGERSTVGAASGKMTNFLHVGDIANALNKTITGGDTRGGSKVYINTAVSNPITLHSADGYLVDVTTLVGVARDSASPFYSTKLAGALRSGVSWDGGDKYGTTIQIGLLDSTHSSLSTSSDDSFVLGGSRDDSIVTSKLLGLLQTYASSTGRVIDGRSGTDTVTFASSRSGYDLIDRAGGATLIKYKGDEVATLYHVERLAFSDGPTDIKGKSLVAQKSTPGQKTFNVSSKADWADAGPGDMKVQGSAGDDTIYAAGGNKTILGGAGNDVIIIRTGTSHAGDVVTIDGGTGTDTMQGGKGNETFKVDNKGDLVLDAKGFDKVISSVSFVLSAGIEVLQLTGKADNGTGNSSANTIIGNGRANVLDGAGGADTISGLGGKDILIGGAGRDMLTGGKGKDVFDLNAISESGKTAKTRDVITDFAHSVDDIDLSTIDASSKATGNQAFKFIGAVHFHKVARELHYLKQNLAGTTNDKTIVEGDVNGDGRADFQIELTGLKTLTASDFVL